MLSALVLTTVLTAAAAKVAPKPDDLNAFVAERQRSCLEYRAASDAKKKTKLFSRYAKAAKQKSYSVASVQATVTDIETTADTGRISLTVSTPFGECTNRDLWAVNSAYHVEKGTPLYEAIEGLADGDEVTVSLALVKPWLDDVFQEESVCGKRWVVQYTRLERVP